MWRPRTLEDELLERQAVAAPARMMAGFTAETETTEEPPAAPPVDVTRRVPCACGRLCPPFELVDVRSLPPEVRGDREYMCCACRRRLFRRGIITESEFIAMLGGPADVVAWHRAAEERKRREKENQRFGRKPIPATREP